MDSHLKIVYEKEAKVSFIDSLTDLFNHGFFQIVLDWEVKRSQRYGSPFTLALIDIDSFSGYNRKYGTMKGDRVLREIAMLIKENIREVDVAARYSGDVFTVILTKSESQQSLQAVERIRQAVEKMFGGIPTVSIGLASYPKDATNVESLSKIAHNALLQAKLRGKNRVYLFEGKISDLDDEKSKVLLVDDEPLNLKLMEAILRPLNYEVITTSNGEEALSIINKVDIDLILSDIMMPEMDGYELCRRLKGNDETRLIPIIMITALNDTEAKIKSIEAGADEFITKPPDKMELLARTNSLIKIKKLNNNLISIEKVLFSLAKAVEAKDKYTEGHILRVSNMAVALGKKMGLSQKKIKAIEIGGMLHDIGKIAVPEEILNKPGRLNLEELEIIKKHPDAGYKICLPLKDTLGTALDSIRYHHEKLDGSGYPDGLKGEEIPVVALIMGVVDIYDALTTNRPYQKAKDKQEALNIISKEAEEGKLDKQVVKYLKEIVT